MRRDEIQVVGSPHQVPRRSSCLLGLDDRSQFCPYFSQTLKPATTDAWPHDIAIARRAYGIAIGGGGSAAGGGGGVIAAGGSIAVIGGGELDAGALAELGLAEELLPLPPFCPPELPRFAKCASFFASGGSGVL